jgi:hypothetical protein
MHCRGPRGENIDSAFHIYPVSAIVGVALHPCEAFIIIQNRCFRQINRRLLLLLLAAILMTAQSAQAAPAELTAKPPPAV